MLKSISVLSVLGVALLLVAGCQVTIQPRPVPAVRVRVGGVRQATAKACAWVPGCDGRDGR